jgi:hypothetical protein
VASVSFAVKNRLAQPTFFVARLVESACHPSDRKFILLNFQALCRLDILLSSFGHVIALLSAKMM